MGCLGFLVKVLKPVLNVAFLLSVVMSHTSGSGAPYISFGHRVMLTTHRRGPYGLALSYSQTVI